MKCEPKIEASHRSRQNKSPRVTIRAVAARAGVTPTSVSAVLNSSPAARAIPERTKNRILQAARELNYCPDFVARSLRTGRSYLIAIVVQSLDCPWLPMVLPALEKTLRRGGYILVIGPSNAEVEDASLNLFRQRGVEALIAVNTKVRCDCGLPVITIEVGGLNTPDQTSLQSQQRFERLGQAIAETTIDRVRGGGAQQKPCLLRW